MKYPKENKIIRPSKYVRHEATNNTKSPAWIRAQSLAKTINPVKLRLDEDGAVVQDPVPAQSVDVPRLDRQVNVVLLRK